MNISEATKKACEKPTLLEALTDICIWESERIVKQARKNEQWETCFKVCLREVMAKYGKNSTTEKIFCMNCQHLRLSQECHSPHNCTDNWQMPGGNQDKKPEDLNRNNDCKWYEEKK